MARHEETYQLLIDMREDIIDCYREVAPDCLLQKTAWKKIQLHPAKRFYVTPKQVYQKINYWMNGRPEEIDNMKRPLRRKMYYDLIKVVLEISQKPENVGKSLYKLCEIAVRQPAPQFYLSKTQILIIFSKYINGVFSEDGRDLVNANRVMIYKRMQREKLNTPSPDK